MNIQRTNRTLQPKEGALGKSSKFLPEKRNRQNGLRKKISTAKLQQTGNLENIQGLIGLRRMSGIF